MIYTSYWANVPELIVHGIEPVGISRSVPKGFMGRRIMSLAPTWNMLKMSDEDYDKAYKKILQNNDRSAIIEMFRGKDVALLCWEKNNNDCHRKQVAEWLREGGCECEEFSAESKQLSIF